MADIKVTGLPAITALSTDDLVMVVDDPAGSPVSNKVTVADLFGASTPVAANVTLGNKLRLDDARAVGAPDLSWDGFTGTGLYMPADNTIGVVTGGTERARWSSAGRLLIGHTTDLNALVQIARDITDAQVLSISGHATDSAANRIGFRKSRGTRASPTIVIAGDSLGGLRFSGWDGSVYQPGAQIQAVVDATPGAGDMPGALVFSTTPDGSSSFLERMRIKNNGNIEMAAANAANVLIGTTTDAGTGERLQMVFGTAGTAAVSRVEHSDTANGGSHASLLLKSGGASGGDPYIRFLIGAGVQNWALGPDNDDSDKFKLSRGSNIGTNDAIVVDTSNQVGIGTSSPARALHFSNASAAVMAVERTGATTSAFLLAAESGLASIYARATESSSTAIPLRFLTGSGERARITADGNVLIGTTTDSGQLLQVRKDTAGSATTLLIQNNDNTAGGSHARIQLQTGGASGGDPYYYFSTAVTDWAIGIDNSDSDKLKISRSTVVGTNDAIVVDTSNAVSMSPDADQTITLGRAVLSSPATNIAYFAHFDNATASRYALRQNEAGSTIVNSATGTNLDLSIANVAQVRLTSGGNVLIGTTTDGEGQLQVSKSSIGATPVDTNGIGVINPTAAAAGAQQYSPPIRWEGQGWKTDATAASQKVEFRSYVIPVEGAAAPTANWVLESSVNSGAYGTPGLLVNSNGFVGINATAASARLHVVESVAGTVGTNLYQHTDNTNSSSSMFLRILTGGASGGDPYIRFDVNSVQQWSIGIDNSDSDKFVLSRNTTLGTNNAIVVDTSNQTTISGGLVVNSSAVALTIDTSARVLVGTTSSIGGKLQVKQAVVAGAIPVITLDQDDVSEEFIRLIGESAADASQSLVDAADLTTPGSIVGYFKMYVQDDAGAGPITDGVYYVPFYSAPTA